MARVLQQNPSMYSMIFVEDEIRFNALSPQLPPGRSVKQPRPRSDSHTVSIPWEEGRTCEPARLLYER